MDVSDHFDPSPGYLNTATVGLPPIAGLDALHARLDEWRAGASDPVSFDEDVDECRRAYGRLVGVDAARVAVTSQVSVVSGMVAASLPAGSVVLCADGDFASVTFPFHAFGRLEVRTVPLAELVGRIDADVDLVAVSAVQSSDGTVLDLDGLTGAATAFGCRTFVDVTQGAGWLTIGAGSFDVTACHGYKWLCAPRGAGFMTATEEAAEWLIPVGAGWYAGADRWGTIYGPPLPLAGNAHRFDLSPAWFSYSAAVPALELLGALGVESIRDHSVGLANKFRVEVGLEPSNSAIVSVAVDDPGVFSEAGVAAALRAGGVRLSFYVYNTVDDVERAVAAHRRAV